MRTIKSIHRLLATLALTWLAWGPLSACAAAATDSAATPIQAGALADEAHAFINKIKSGALLGMSDEQLLKTFNQLDPQLISVYLDLGVKSLNEYEIWTQRQERMGGNWANKPFVNYIKYRHKPRQVYMKWLKESPKSGQEIIYDETKRKDAMYGHIGGLFNITSVWASLDGSLAKGNSNHTVRDLGMQSVVDLLVAGNRARVKEGIPTAPNQIEVIKVNGDRTVAMTWIAPAGMKGGYAYKSKIYVDLKQPWVRMTESWDEHGDIIERVSFDKIVPASFTDADFDPKNSSYAF